MRSAAADVPAPLSVQRLRLACVGLALTLMTFAQSSGSEAADTKLDLVVAPARFLRNALTMWDPTAAAGQLQDQAYGYLFPMGPFFLLGKLSALSPWVVQRSWESLLLIAAFLGMVRLARLLGVPGFWPRVGAGLAYALAPRMLMEIGVISSELLPVVVLPWVLIPLVRGAEGGSPRRAAARSGVALLFASGINAAATLAILPVPALWLLTRSRGPRRRALMRWWAVAVGLACLWWVVPLVVLGKYSPPFLDWIESSTVTTSRTSLIAVLRGADHWEAYLGPNVWPAGWILAAAPAAILATTAVAVLGVAGVARRPTPHRLFLISALLVGLVLLTLGHVATVGPPFAGSVRQLLDGVLAPFRNIHKFDAVVRLPISIGLGHALAAVGRRAPARAPLRVRGGTTTVYPRALLALAVVGIAATAIAPALMGRLVPQTRSVNDPSWWSQTGTWLGQHDAGGRALVVPGAAQPAYVWGAPRDDALQPVAAGPWTVRDAAPLTQPGYVRLLDAIESVLAGGSADPSLAPVLARSGIRYLVVRNDLDTTASGATALRFVHATIANSPGFALTARFGPDLLRQNDPDRLVDLGLTAAQGTVDVYENMAWRSQVSLLPANGTVVANGSSDQLATLVASGTLTPRTPLVFGQVPGALQDAGIATRTVLTDGIRRREFGFGGVDKYSATMTATQPYRAVRAVHDYLPTDAGPLSTVAYSGISDVQVSSAASAASSGWAALDGDAGTAWSSASLHGAVGQWLQIDLPRTLAVPAVAIAFAKNRASYPTRLRITTDTGSVEDDVTPDSNTQSVALPPGPTSYLRITVSEMTVDRPGNSVALASMAIPGVLPSRTLAVPGDWDADVMTFAVLPGARPACLTVDAAAACDPAWASSGEEDTALDRTFRLIGAADYRAQVGLQLQPGTGLNRLLDAGNPLRVLASSVDSADPRERPGAAVDGNATTGWVAKAGDRLPSIEVTTARRHRIDGITLRPIEGSPAAAPTRVLVTVGSRSFDSDVPDDGRILFPTAVVANSVRVTVLGASLRVSTDSVTGKRRLLPVGIGELQLLGADVPAGRVSDRIHLPCGAGPSLLYNGTAVGLSLDVPADAALGGETVTASVCGTGIISMAAGTNRIRVAADQLVRPESVTLLRTTASAAASEGATGTASGSLTVRRWSDTRRDVEVSTAAPAFLSVAENANAGWSATIHGKRLQAVMLDGWHQGWLLPAGSVGVVHLVFGPQRAAIGGLALGALAIVVLLLGALPIRGRPGRALPAVGETVPRPRSLAVLAVVGLTAAGGLAGAVIAAAVLALRARLRPRCDGRTATLVAAPLLLAGAAEAIAPVGSARDLAGSSGVQLLCLAGLAGLVTALLPAAAPRPAVAAEQRALDEVEGQRGDGGGRHGRDQEQREEVAVEDPPMHAPLDVDQ